MLAQKTKFPLNQCRFYGAEITCAFEYLHEVIDSGRKLVRTDKEVGLCQFLDDI